MLASVFIGIILSVTTTIALPTLVPRRGVTALKAAQIAAFKPYALLSRAGYCPSSRVATWSCGAPCSELPGMTVYASGGDGVVTPFWFVGYYPALNSVVISNQGTDPSKFVPLLIDVDFRLDRLDTTLFPGIPSSVKTHNGFQEAQARSAKAKLVAVKEAIAKHGTSPVTLTGHSLGAAVSLIDALYLSIHLPSVKLKVVTHGMPRVGNLEFAALIDSQVCVPRICWNNKTETKDRLVMLLVSTIRKILFLSCREGDWAFGTYWVKYTSFLLVTGSLVMGGTTLMRGALSEPFLIYLGGILIITAEIMMVSLLALINVALEQNVIDKSENIS
ncbi:unnamed protein product [Rhizoctonia solani]|uniref:Fungal lipase-type domain-containing protein n=1 Tax=Rhizoctonia solani TaxID=456999 RepID=A0A8H3DP19_9AGAM|nr:unnamed protein product [Rhizoctonia solani]